MLQDWEHTLDSFVKVMPKDYKRVLVAEREALAEGRDPVEAVMAASRV
jgi:glutamate synthase (NADPH/NADH) large chain